MSERFVIGRHKGDVFVLDTNNDVAVENLEMFGVEFDDEDIAKYIAVELEPIVRCLNEQDRLMKENNIIL